MTIIQEDKLTISLDSDIPFQHLRYEVQDALRNDRLLHMINDEKLKRFQSVVDYQEFKDLVSTVQLKPFRRIARRNRREEDEDNHEVTAQIERLLH